MTSKEIIQNEIDNLKNMLKNAKDLNCESIIKCSEEEIEQYNQVLKDLEKLEKYEKLYETIKQKKENAENDLKMIMSDNNKRLLLVGKIEAYTDIMCLIESSGELDE